MTESRLDLNLRELQINFHTVVQSEIRHLVRKGMPRTEAEKIILDRMISRTTGFVFNIDDIYCLITV
jgi:hypothetical protein